MARQSETQTVSVAGQRLRLTNPDKVIYPSTGTTKAEVIAYYMEIAPHLLPHLADRIVTVANGTNSPRSWSNPRMDLTSAKQATWARSSRSAPRPE